PFSPSSASTSPAPRSRSTPSSARTPGKDFEMPRISSNGASAIGTFRGKRNSPLQGGIVLPVVLPGQPGPDQSRRGHGTAVEIAQDRLHRQGADPVRELHRVGVDLAVADGLLAFGLAVEADDLDLPRLARLLDGRPRPECGGVVDGED